MEDQYGLPPLKATKAIPSSGQFRLATLFCVLIDWKDDKSQTSDKRDPSALRLIYSTLQYFMKSNS